MTKTALAGLIALLMSTSANAVTYTVGFISGDISVNGFITTDGTLGASDGIGVFTDFELNVSGTGFDFTFTDPFYNVGGSALLGGGGTPWTLTPTELSFDFGTPTGFIGGFTDSPDLATSTQALFLCSGGFCSFDTGSLSGFAVNVPGDTVAETSESGVFVFGTADDEEILPVVPLPASIGMLLGGLGGLAVLALYRRRKTA